MTDDQLRELIRALENLEPGDTNWLAVLIPPFAVLLVGGLAFWQKMKSDARAEWWRRAQWALESKASKNKDLKENGLSMLDVLTGSRLAGRDERKFLRFVMPVPTISANARERAEQPDWTEPFMEALRAANPDASDEDLNIAARYASDFEAMLDEPDEDGDNGDSEEDRK